MSEMISAAEKVTLPPVQNWTINQDEVEIDYDKNDDTLWVSFSFKTRLGTYFGVKDSFYLIMFPSVENKYYPVGFYIENWNSHYIAKNKELKHFWNEKSGTLKNVGGWDNTIPNLIEAILATKAGKK